VQAAREAARRAQCQNNLKQMGLGVLHHTQAHGFYPSGGWGLWWVGDPDQGNKRNQPGGWIYNILPYMEQANLHDLGSGRTFAQKQTINVQMVTTPLPAFQCPSRRAAKTYTHTFGTVGYNCGVTNVVARSDYAANSGTTWEVIHERGPVSIAAGSNIAPPADRDGIIFERSELKPALVKDGASNTLLAGEKYVRADMYINGADPGDDQNMYVGNDNDINRVTRENLVLMQDLPAAQSPAQAHDRFCSAHSGGAFFVRCDGSTLTLHYGINPTTYQRLGSRSDGQVIDAGRL
jgi:hypothetical protein